MKRACHQWLDGLRMLPPRRRPGAAAALSATAAARRHLHLHRQQQHQQQQQQLLLPWRQASSFLRQPAAAVAGSSHCNRTPTHRCNHNVNHSNNHKQVKLAFGGALRPGCQSQYLNIVQHQPTLHNSNNNSNKQQKHLQHPCCSAFELGVGYEKMLLDAHALSSATAATTTTASNSTPQHTEMPTTANNHQTRQPQTQVHVLVSCVDWPTAAPGTRIKPRDPLKANHARLKAPKQQQTPLLPAADAGYGNSNHVDMAPHTRGDTSVHTAVAPSAEIQGQHETHLGMMDSALDTLTSHVHQHHVALQSSFESFAQAAVHDTHRIHTVYMRDIMPLIAPPRRPHYGYLDRISTDEGAAAEAALHRLLDYVGEHILGAGSDIEAQGWGLVVASAKQAAWLLPRVRLHPISSQLRAVRCTANMFTEPLHAAVTEAMLSDNVEIHGESLLSAVNVNGDQVSFAEEHEEGGGEHTILEESKDAAATFRNAINSALRLEHIYLDLIKRAGLSQNALPSVRNLSWAKVIMGNRAFLYNIHRWERVRETVIKPCLHDQLFVLGHMVEFQQFALEYRDAMESLMSAFTTAVRHTAQHENAMMAARLDDEFSELKAFPSMQEKAIAVALAASHVDMVFTDHPAAFSGLSDGWNSLSQSRACEVIDFCRHHISVEAHPMVRAHAM